MAQVENLERLARERSTKGFFREAQNIQKGFQPRCYAVRNNVGELSMSLGSVLETWSDYFEDLLNVESDPTPVENELIYHTAEVCVEQPTKDEFLLALNKLKNNKAPGTDGTAEMIFHGGDELHDKLYQLMLTIWNSEELPTEWKVAILCPIHKKGDRLNCENYRGIALLNTAYKIFANILLERIKVEIIKVKYEID